VNVREETEPEHAGTRKIPNIRKLDQRRRRVVSVGPLQPRRPRLPAYEFRGTPRTDRVARRCCQQARAPDTREAGDQRHRTTSAAGPGDPVTGASTLDSASIATAAAGVKRRRGEDRNRNGNVGQRTLKPSFAPSKNDRTPHALDPAIGGIPTETARSGSSRGDDSKACLLSTPAQRLAEAMRR